MNCIGLIISSQCYIIFQDTNILFCILCIFIFSGIIIFKPPWTLTRILMF